MRRMVLCVLVACGGSSDGPTGPITAHVTHYDYRFDIDTRAAHAQVTTIVDVGGDCLDLPFRADGPETTCDFTFDGGPTYSTFGVAAYPETAWPAHDRGNWGSVHVTVFDRASTGINAAIDNAYHDGFIKFMESTFGPFPFGSEL